MRATVERRTTAADVAREAGVSPATVGFVLNRTKGQTISEETRTRVLAAAEHLNYKPHQAARALRSGRNKIVLLVLPDWPLEHSLRINLEVLTRALAAYGYALITFTPVPDSSAKPLWAILEPDVVIGYEPFSDDDLADMKSVGIRNIIPAPEATTVRIPANFPSGPGPHLQTEHLLGLGHKRLGFAYPPDPRLAEHAEARLQAVNRACSEAGVPQPIVRSVHFQDGSATSAIAAWQEEGITAVIAYNDDVAADVVSGAVRYGIRVPEDLSIIGHDNSPLAARFIPSISSVEVDVRRLATYTAALALHLAEGYPLPDPPTDLAVLVPRESTGDH